MKTVGSVLWVLGILLFGYALLGFETSVESAAGGEYGMPSRIINMGLQQQQLLLGLAGLAAFVAGAIVHALAVVAEAIAPPAFTTATPVEPSTKLADLVVAPEDEPALMAKHGITREGDHYSYSGFRYEQLKDAVAYARRAESR